ncbi:chromatin assembly factor 1 subunit A-domain-containing protein [Scheffersomyces coipomensis]|uniref:chromatin assembly factor 1 subunit A-domain-containing protein n=1 Tax=Scheffersomyces coipomensis TaxID=1788519 RepID=UPI00315DE84B
MTVEAKMQSPALTPLSDSVKEIINLDEDENIESTPIKRKQTDDKDDGDDSSDNNNTKKAKLATPDITSTTPIPESETKKLTKKELQKIENQKKREIERIEREKKKEEERLLKEHNKKVREDERLKKLAEKELEKEQKRKKLEDEKIQREKLKEEERLQKLAKMEERERLRKEKKQKEEDDKKRLEEDKKRLEEEKRKAEELKERSQSKISNFFKIKVQPTTTTPKKNNPNQSSVANSPLHKGTNPILIEDTSKISDYESDFLPFFIQKNVVLADNGSLSPEQKQKSIKEFDDDLKDSESSDLKSYFNSFKTNDDPISQSITPDAIINELNSATTSETIIYELIQKLPPIKYLQFYENSKPPYIGTWCSLRHQKIHIPVVNPINTELTGFDYEYDSDLEWNNKEDGEDDEDGEDIDDDEDDDEEPNLDDDDMLDFVEDNNLDQNNKSKKFHSLIVINKWNDGSNQDIFDKLITVPLITELMEGEPIDPNKDYWNPTANEATIVSVDVNLPKVDANSSSGTSTTTSTSTSTTPNILIPQKKTIQDATILGQLITFIEKNNDFSIQTLVELSKKQFKDFTKALLKNTIQEIATYNKKTTNWDVKPELKAKYVV